MSQVYAKDPEGRPVLDLRREAALRRPDLHDLPELTGAERQLAIRTWRGRMVNEHLSARVWAALVGQLVAAAAPPQLIAEAAEAVADELRHAELCGGVVLALGGSPVARLTELEEIPDHAGAGPLEAVLRNVVSVGCMSETVAVSIIRAEHAEIQGTVLGGVLARILADEIAHARFGWRALSMLLPALDADARVRLDAYLAVALAHQVEHEVPKLPRLLGLRPESGQAGVCDGGFARSLFVDTLTDVIVPGLDKAGLNGTAAWASAREATATLLAS